MGRPPLRPGTYGKVGKRELPNGSHEAHATMRMGDGSTQRVRKYAKSAPAAERALKDRLVELAKEVRGGDITSETRMQHIAKLWIEEWEEDARLGKGSLTTLRLYKGSLDNHVLPAVGQLQAGEVRVRMCEKLFKKVRDDVGYPSAKTTRAVLSALCAYAVRHGAMATNPVRSAAPIAGEKKKVVVALTPAQVADIRVKLHGFAETKQVDAKGRSVGSRGKVWYDLEDIVDAMLSTGGRIGEVLACDGKDVHATEQEVILAHHVVRISGEGLVRQELRKGNEEGLVLAVPAWSVPMWRRRKLASGGGKLFPSWNGEWLDPSNVIGRLKEALTAIGYGWLTSHVLRKTAAKVLDDANLPTSAIADQLGNSQKVVEKHYRRKRASNQAAAAALEVLG